MNHLFVDKPSNQETYNMVFMVE